MQVPSVFWPAGLLSTRVEKPHQHRRGVELTIRCLFQKVVGEPATAVSCFRRPGPGLVSCYRRFLLSTEVNLRLESKPVYYHEHQE